jgi:hypothetical protein
VKADLTRDTFSPLRHFARVLGQQGRVQLDADGNEQTAILLHYLQALAADLIGPHGGPVDNEGFTITALPTSTAGAIDFRIGAGRYYVSGILCEVDSPGVSVVRPSGPATNVLEVAAWTIDGMPFLPGQNVEIFDDVPPTPASPFASQVLQIKDAPDPVKRQLTFASAVPDFTKASAPSLRHVVTYMTQADYPVPSTEILSAGAVQVYLDVWERTITSVEDDHIREVALGGPDTCARSKIVWQVKITTAADGGGCLSPQQLTARFRPSPAGRLRAMARQDATSTDPCILPPDAAYRGMENQLYRVEIHRPGAAWNGADAGKATAATFKWSRDNGTVVFAVASVGANSVVVEHLGRDDRSTLSEGDWVEIQDDDSVLQNRAGALLQVQGIDRTTMTVTLSGAPDANIGRVASKHPLLRRWDHKMGDPTEGGLQIGPDGAMLLIEDSGDNWLALERGVKIQFRKPDPGEPANHYQTSDYWLIPARVATGDVEWPIEPFTDSNGNAVRAALPPAGVRHCYAPLAVVTFDANGKMNPNSIECRLKFKNAVELTPQQ